MAKKTSEPIEEFWTLHRHDARELDGLFSAQSNGRPLQVMATITSPPYGALKDYGAKGQIGFGQSYEDYLRDMEHVFGQIYDRTAEHGSLWLIADTYVADGPAPRPLLPVPFDLAKAAESAGFTLRDVIIWQKDRTLPWSNGTRLRNAFEYVLLLVKGSESKYHLDRLREHSDVKEWWVRFPERYSPKGKAPSNVWNIPIPVQGSWGNGELDHSCPLPPELVRRLVLLSTDPGDVVLDPFAGSGVVLAVADRLGRKAVGCEIVERHAEEYERIIKPEIQALTGDMTTNGRVDSKQAQLLINLRILKFARVLMQTVAKRRDVPWPAGALALRGPKGGQALARPRIVFLVEGDEEGRNAYKQRAKEAAAERPASKFGLEAEIDVIGLGRKGLLELARGRRLHLYLNGRTTRAVRAVPHGQIQEEVHRAASDSVPPILSNIHVDVAPRPDATVLESLSLN
jgi:DNA modification methylase